MTTTFSFVTSIPALELHKRFMPAVMSDLSVNGTEEVNSAFASALATSPLLRRYASDPASRAEDRPRKWDDQFRLYPERRTGWARVERAVALAEAYWELIGVAIAGRQEKRERRRNIK